MADIADRWRGGIPASATAIVQKVEGFKAAPYQDTAGVWTYGWGSIRDAAGNPVTRFSPPVTQAQALALLQRDMGSAERTVHAAVLVALTDSEAAALISFAYNEGNTAFRGSTLLKQLNAGSPGSVPDELHKWILSGHPPVPTLGLVRRRWAEAALFGGADVNAAITDAWSKIKKVTDWPAF